MKNNNLIWKKVKVWFWFHDWVDYEWEIVAFSPATWFFKSFNTVSILLDDWTIVNDVSLSLITIKKND